MQLVVTDKIQTENHTVRWKFSLGPKKLEEISAAAFTGDAAALQLGDSDQARGYW
jgi:hypothetical protein